MFSLSQNLSVSADPTSRRQTEAFRDGSDVWVSEFISAGGSDGGAFRDDQRTE